MLVILKDSQRFELFVILDSIIAFYVGSCKFDYSLLRELIFILNFTRINEIVYLWPRFGESRNDLWPR